MDIDSQPEKYKAKFACIHIHFSSVFVATYAELTQTV